MMPTATDLRGNLETYWSNKSMIIAIDYYNGLRTG